MKISIIIPVYNVSEYIVRCIESVIDQTYDNIECILVDDYSPDDSIDLINRRLESHDGKIEFKIIRHEQNKGLSGARNSGTQVSTGEYIYYLDSDDCITTPTSIETLVELAKKYPQTDLIQGNTQTIPAFPEGKDWRNISLKNFPEYVNDNNWIRRKFYITYGMQAIPVNAWNKLIKRSFIFDNNLFFKDGLIHEDEEWMYRAVKKMKSIAFTTQYTYTQYQREGSIMRSGSNYKSLQAWSVILREILNDVEEPYYNCFKRKYVSGLYFRMCQIDLKSNESELFPQFKELVKLAINNFSVTERLPLYILLSPQEFYKSAIGRLIFFSLLKLFIH